MLESLSINKKSNTTSWICAFLLFVISFPKWVWNTSPVICLTVVPYVLLLFALKDMMRNKAGLREIMALFFQILIIWVYYISTTSNFNARIAVLLRTFAFAPLFFCSPNFWKKSVDCFIKLLAVFLIFALIEHVLISFFGIQLTSPSQYECPINPDRLYNAYFFNVYLQNSFGFFNRFYAFYDEPGVIGNILMVLLYIQKFDLKRWYNIVFLISGLLSFSLAFYFALIAYYILFGKFRAKIAFVIVASALTYYLYENEYIYNLLFGRLTFEDGGLAGYNRENIGFKNWIYSISWKDYLFWGYQPREAVVYAASWQWAFALWGIVPSILYLISVVNCRIRSVSDKNSVLSGLMLVVIIWIQRPFVYMYLYVLLLMLPFMYSKDDDTATNKTAV